jgi:UDP-N-acetylglucosamine diphosphorylase / glucose-1-phosphate thymidylyltransferase / UDP-N-acetylgalactosamine diphosphorylase / glucosamine-1-phosphate N-acetyltransferase / galactosamine-1-phosphate N-acetyltransferase
MQAVILAAGKGTRMRELCHDCPKPMVKLLGKPLLEWRIETLPEGVDEVILVVGYLQEQIRTYFGDEWQGRKITYVNQEALNGTGGAMMLLKPFLRGNVLVTNGDDLYHTQDLEQLVKKASDGGAVIGMTVNDAEKYGLLEVHADGSLLAITERPHDKQVGVVNTGTYIITGTFFDFPLVPITETEYGLPQTLALVARKYPVAVTEATAWQPVGCPEDIPDAEAFIQKYFL